MGRINRSYLKELAKKKKFGQEGLEKKEDDRIVVPGVLQDDKDFYYKFMQSPRYNAMLEGKHYTPFTRFTDLTYSENPIYSGRKERGNIRSKMWSIADAPYLIGTLQKHPQSAADREDFRQKRLPIESAEYIKKARLQNLEGKNPDIYTYPTTEQFVNRWNGEGRAPSGFSEFKTGDIYMNPFYYEGMKDIDEDTRFNILRWLPSVRQVETHELSHTIDRPRGGYEHLIPIEDITAIKQKTLGSQQKFLDEDKYDRWKYLSTPTEVRARLNVVRKALNDKGIDIGTKTIEPEDLESLKDTDVSDLNDLRDILKEEDIIWMLNNISKNETPQKEKYAKSGAYIPTEDKQFSVKKSTIPGANKGLFSKTPIKQGKLIGLAHENNQPVGTLGNMHNHSETPNMQSVKIGNQRYVYATRDIQPGEELTTNYRLQPELEQPENFMGNKRFGQMGISVPAPSFSDEFVSWINPFNWGVTDYSQYKTYNQAFDAARKAGEKEFMWKANRYNTRKDTDDLNIKNPPRPLALRRKLYPEQLDYFKAHPMTGKNYSDFIKNNYPEFFKVMNRGKGVGAIDFQGHSTSPTRASYYPFFNTIHVGENFRSNSIPSPKYDNYHYEPFMGSIIAEMAHLKNPESGWRTIIENLKYGDPGKYYVPGSMEYEAHRLHEPGLAITAYGNLSPSDIKRIQRHLGVKDDGIFGQKTYKALQEKYKNSPEIKMLLPSYYRTSKDRDLNIQGMGKKPSLALAYLRQINKDVPLKNAYRFLHNSSSSNRSMSNEYDYTDNALLNIVPGSGDYDVKELQQALVNRGYKLPKSTKKSPNGYSPGGLDGVWGEETKAALEDWQNKTRKQIANQQILKKTGQKGFYKPDFRTKSQIANAQGQQRENTYVKPVVKNAAQLQRINQIQEQERQRRIKEAADKVQGTLRETNDADREAMNREDYTLLGRAQKLGRGDFNPLVLAAGAADLINPAAYWYAGKDLVRGAQEVEKGISNLDLGQVGSGLLQTGLSALYVAPGVRAAGAPIVKNVAPLIKPVVKPVYNAVSSVVNSPKLNYLLEYKRLPKSLENIKKSPEASIEKIVNPKIDQVDQSARSYRFLEGLEKGAASLDESVAKRIKDLESAEGFKRLVAQEKEYLKSINYKGPVNTRAEINAQARINELKGYRNVNKEAGKYRKENIVTSNNEFVKDPDLYNNAYYNIPESNLTNMIVNDLYTPDLSSFNYGSSSQVPFVNIMKSPQLGSKVIPGEIGIGYNFIKNKPIEMHEIAHALQRRRILPFDKEIAKSITPKRYLTSGEKNSYKYFSKGSKKREPSAFLNELRESMQQKGFIPDYYSEIKPEQVQAAYNYFRKNPIGVFKPESGLGKKFLSNTRIFDFMEPNQSNFQELSRLLNKAPAIVGAVGTGLGVGTLQQNQKPKGTYQGGGINVDLKLPQFEEDKPRPFFEITGAGTGPQYDVFGYGYVPLGKNLGISADLMRWKEGDWRGGGYGISGNINIPINRGERKIRPTVKDPVMFQGGGTMGIPGVNGQVVSSGPTPLTSVKKTRGSMSMDNEGNIKTMPTKAVKKILKNIK